MSQRDQVKQHLESGRSITPIEALNLYHTFRLSSIILRLRRAGLDIKTEMIDNKYARYFISQTEKVNQ